jgi:hypothetical protein
MFNEYLGEKWKRKIYISSAVFSNGFGSNADENLCRTVVHLILCKALSVNVCSFSCYEKIFKITVVLQNCINLREVLPGSYGETYQAGDQVISINAEQLSYVEEAFVPITFREMNTEDEVSCVCVQCYPHFTNIQCSLLFFSSPLW